MAYEYKFERMAVWQASRASCKEIYAVTRKFPKEELFGIVSQLRRAAVSITCNLAEGNARLSEKDKVHFFQIAYGSAVEVVNLLIISRDLEYIQDQEYLVLRENVEKITFLINNLVQSIRPNLREPDVPYET